MAEFETYFSLPVQENNTEVVWIKNYENYSYLSLIHDI